MILYGIRYNPITEEFVPIYIVDEIRECDEFLELPGIYGIYLTEIPERRVPSSTSLRRIGSPDVPFVEVFGAPISAEQYYVSYFNIDIAGFAKVFLPSEEEGNMFKITYYCLGSSTHFQNLRTLTRDYIYSQIEDVTDRIDNLIDDSPNWNDPSEENLPSVNALNERNKRLLFTFAEAFFSKLSQTPSAADNTWNAIAECTSVNSARYVCVASTGTSRVQWSADGYNWTAVTPTANAWQSVARSESLNIFVAVGSSGTGNRAMSSVNGTSWTIRTSASDIAWQSVIWIEDLGMFVAAASGGTNRVMTSTNGTSWTGRATPNTAAYVSLDFSPVLGMIVGVGATTTGQGVMTSTNGTSWTAQNTPGTTVTWVRVKWIDHLSLFVIVGSGGEIATSPDGITWSAGTTITNPSGSVPVATMIYAKSLRKIVIIYNTSGSGFHGIATTEDLVNYSFKTTNSSRSIGTGAIWSERRGEVIIPCTSGTGNRILRSGKLGKIEDFV